VERKYVYCQFPSLLDRILQEDGRLGQLGRNFGIVNDDNHTANCSGLSPNDLDRIAFDQCDSAHPSPRCIDYTEYYQALESQMVVPNQAQTAQQVNKTLEAYYG
jgi:conjugal transfer mating pair stabilization protein TraN